MLVKLIPFLIKLNKHVKRLQKKKNLCEDLLFTLEKKKLAINDATT